MSPETIEFLIYISTMLSLLCWMVTALILLVISTK